MAVSSGAPLFPLSNDSAISGPPLEPLNPSSLTLSRPKRQGFSYDLLTHWIAPEPDPYTRFKTITVRRKTKPDPKKTTCMLYLQCDHLLYKLLGSEEACIEIMTRHIQRVNAIYKSAVQILRATDVIPHRLLEFAFVASSLSPTNGQKARGSEELRNALCCAQNTAPLATEAIVPPAFLSSVPQIQLLWRQKQLSLQRSCPLYLRYSSSGGGDFDRDQKQDGIQFMIKRVKVHSGDVHTDPDYRFLGNYGVEKFLELFSDPSIEFLAEENYDAFCLAYMFTFRDFEGGTLGLAWTGDLKNAGGVCERNGHYRGSQKSLNTGIITLLNYGKRIPPAVSHVTLAHEIGHNFGSPHDPENDKVCTPGGDDGNYIMFARATSGDKRNNNRFSPCSVKAINAVLNSKARSSKGCFTEPQAAICGNGVVEDGEECDCGWEEDCVEQCCFPMRTTAPPFEKPCTLRPGKLCSPSQGPCCTDDCGLKRGDKCRSDNGCRNSAYCNGRMPQCPPSVNKPNKTICNEEFVCYKGRSLRYRDHNLCHLSTSRRNARAQSVSRTDWRVVNAYEDRTTRPPNPANCAVDPSGPLATLRDLLLSDRNLENLQRWITEHWYGVLLIILGFVALLVMIARFCGRQPDSRVKKKITQLYKQADTVLPRSMTTDGSGSRGLMVHPTAVKSKLPLGKKVRETKRQGKRVSYEKVMVKVKKSAGLSTFLHPPATASVGHSKSGHRSAGASGAAASVQKKRKRGHAPRRSSSLSLVEGANGPAPQGKPGSGGSGALAASKGRPKKQSGGSKPATPDLTPLPETTSFNQETSAQSELPKHRNLFLDIVPKKNSSSAEGPKKNSSSAEGPKKNSSSAEGPKKNSSSAEGPKKSKTRPHLPLGICRSRSLSPDKSPIKRRSRDKTPPTASPEEVPRKKESSDGSGSTPPLPEKSLKRPFSFAGSSSDHVILDLTGGDTGGEDSPRESPTQHPALFKRWRTPADIAAACGASSHHSKYGRMTVSGASGPALSYSRSKGTPKHRKVIRYDNTVSERPKRSYDRQQSSPPVVAVCVDENETASGEWVHREVNIPASKVAKTKRTVVVRRKGGARKEDPGKAKSAPPSPPDQLPQGTLNPSMSKASLDSLGNGGDFPPMGSSSDLSSLISSSHSKRHHHHLPHHTHFPAAAKRRSESLCSSIKPLIHATARSSPAAVPLEEEGEEAGGRHHRHGFLKKKRSHSSASDTLRGQAVSILFDDEESGDDLEPIYSLPYDSASSSPAPPDHPPTPPPTTDPSAQLPSAKDSPSQPFVYCSNPRQQIPSSPPPAPPDELPV
ncbi:unnamed protein product [Cyprideis torosa]|uniref:Uncharacterized protein n=1 Tax=Cyprideis torosa TaxID=163714 RepID=A0A7R8ZJC0_9CRUS|nr:unnamed protein product [Cyprideis torosa]CAG0886588.1 unnamed protein product [Cyprideis torosa]